MADSDRYNVACYPHKRQRPRSIHKALLGDLLCACLSRLRRLSANVLAQAGRALRGSKKVSEATQRGGDRSRVMAICKFKHIVPSPSMEILQSLQVALIARDFIALGR